MKKYVHVWFVILAVFLSTILSPTVGAHTYSKKHKHHHGHFHVVKKKVKYKKKKVKQALHVKKRYGKKKVSHPDTIERLIASEYRDDQTHFEQGVASWYGPGFHGRKTASGERFNTHAYTAAHKSLPLGSKIRVTNVDTGKSVVVKVNDRGPFVHGRVVDLSKAAASALGMVKSGTCNVKLERL